MNNLLPKGFSCEEWTEELDTRLLTCGKSLGNNWSQYAIHFPNKSIKKIKSRFQHLQASSTAKQKPFTNKEDEKLGRVFDAYPFDWKAISTFFPSKNAQ